MSGWPVMFRDGSWHVQVWHNPGEPYWVRCDTDADAYQMSLCLELMHAALEGDRVGDEIARELESAAALFSKYGQDQEATWIVEHAKFARGEPSVFDDEILD